MENKNNYQFSVKPRFCLLICLAVFAFYFPVMAKADALPGIFVTDLKINEVKGGAIDGQITIWNSENYYMSDLNYDIELFQGTKIGELKLIDVSVVKETFFAAPGQKILKSFSYQYPQNINSGDYTLMAQVITERGEELGSKYIAVPLTGKNKFFDEPIASAKVLAGGKEFFPLEGANVAPGEKVTGVFKAKNLGAEISVIPKIKIFQRKFNMPLLKEYDGDPITFAAGETKTVSLDMPLFQQPESYLAEVKLYKDNEPVSGIAYFRWVVTGPGGKILYLKVGKDAYDNMVITVTSVGPADFSEIKNGKLEITVYDKSGSVIFQSSKDITLNTQMLSSEITVPINKDLDSPRIDAKITSGQSVLDERTINLPVFFNKAKQPATKEVISNILFYAIPAIIILLLTGFLFYRFKFKKNHPYQGP